MANAIVGTFELLGLASLIGVPIGVLGGVYLAEYGTRVGQLVAAFRGRRPERRALDHLGRGRLRSGRAALQKFSAYAGGLALGFMMIPLIMRTTEEVLLLVPNGYREASLALGISRWKTIVHIVMKTASKGIITGILLALARIAGETAPLLFTAFGNRFWNHDLAEPIAALPLQIFTYAISPYDDWHRQAWAGALGAGRGNFCHQRPRAIPDSRTGRAHCYKRMPPSTMSSSEHPVASARSPTPCRPRLRTLPPKRPAFRGRKISRSGTAKNRRSRMSRIDIPAKRSRPSLARAVAANRLSSAASIACTSWSRARGWKARFFSTAKIFMPPDVDPAMIRRRVGMVFQKSNPFPTMSIEENVLVGLRLNGVRDGAFLTSASRNRCAWPRSGMR